ncbi:MAG TPA: DUF6151 family protein [Rhizomicrobium sp.]|jgi:hypothetical protein
MASREVIAACVCGKVELEAHGEPIAAAICYCNDCQAGGHMIEALPNAPKVLNADGGTDYILYRKDRARVTKGAELLKSLKLKEGSSTNRVIATCCNSAVMLTFDGANHWLDFYRNRVTGGQVPPVQMLVCTKTAPEPERLPKGVPNYPTHSLRFIGKLLRAKLAMVFGR